MSHWTEGLHYYNYRLLKRNRKDLAEKKDEKIRHTNGRQQSTAKYLIYFKPPASRNMIL